MFSDLKFPLRKGCFRVLAILACCCTSAVSQNFTLRVTDPNPLGIGNFVPDSSLLPQMGPSIEGGMEGGIKGAFFYGLAMSTTYDSNFNLAEDNEESEVSAYLSPSLSYVSDPEGGAPVSLIVNYQPNFSVYYDNSDLNDFDQSANATLSLNGARTNLDLFGTYSQLAGSDRLSGGFVTGSQFNGGVRFGRQIAARTSLNASATLAQSTYDSDDLEGTRIFTGYFGGLWAATPRLGVGSSVRYTRGDSDNSGIYESWALLADARYNLGERIWLSASVGPEFSSNEDSDSVSLAVDLSARYVINERWSWRNSIRTANVSAPSDAGYVVNNLAFNTGLDRKLLRGSLSGGLEFDYSDFEPVGAVFVDLENEQNLSLFLSYNRPLFSERLDFSSMIRYNLNDGESDWRQFLVTLGLNVSF